MSLGSSATDNPMARIAPSQAGTTPMTPAKTTHATAMANRVGRIWMWICSVGTFGTGTLRKNKLNSTNTKKLHPNSGMDQLKNCWRSISNWCIKKILCVLPNGVKALPKLAAIPIKVTGRISGSWYFLATRRYNGTKVKTVTSLERNMLAKIARKINHHVNWRVLFAREVNR